MILDALVLRLVCALPTFPSTAALAACFVDALCEVNSMNRVEHFPCSSLEWCNACLRLAHTYNMRLLGWRTGTLVRRVTSRCTQYLHACCVYAVYCHPLQWTSYKQPEMRKIMPFHLIIHAAAGLFLRKCRDFLYIMILYCNVIIHIFLKHLGHTDS